MNTEKIQAYALVGLLGAVSVLVFFIFKPFLMPLALAAIFAVVLQPVFRHILQVLPGWRRLASLLTILLTVLILLIPLSYITINVIGEAQGAYSSLTQGGTLASTQSAILYLGQSLEPRAPGSLAVATSISEDLNTYITRALEWLLSHVSAAFAGALGFIVSFFIFIYALFVFLQHGPDICVGLKKLSPFRDEDDERILGQLGLTVNSVVRGSLTIAFLQGIVAGLGYVVFGVPNPLLWGVATSLASLVPAIGTGAVIAPAVLYLLVSGQSVSALGLAIWGIAAVGLIDNFLGPILIGRGVKLSPLVILLSVLGGLSFFGPAGIFLGPLAVSLLLVLFGLYADAGKRRSSSAA